MKFYYGFSISAYQTEGNNIYSDWYFYENLGKLPKCGNACNLWEKYDDLIDILIDLNVNAFRFSIEWSRIFPFEKKYSISSLMRYSKFINKLKENKIEPLITLWHFTNPIWFLEKGGWEKKENIEYFLEYVDLVTRNLDVTYYIIFNEPLVYISSSYISGVWPPFKKIKKIEDFKIIIDILENIRYAAEEAYKIIKQNNPNAKIIYTENLSQLLSFSLFEKDLISFIYSTYPRNIDIVGINYYGKSINLEESKKRKYRLDLKHFDSVLNIAKNKFNLPIIITETGINTEDEVERVKFLKKILYFTLRNVKKYNLLGIFIWSLCDNYEWDIGYEAKFGIMTKELKPKDSYYEMKKLFEMIRLYLNSK